MRKKGSESTGGAERKYKRYQVEEEAAGLMGYGVARFRINYRLWLGGRGFENTQWIVGWRQDVCGTRGWHENLNGRNRRV